MTEEEAKKKWCPFARAASAIGPVAVNRMETSLTEDGSIADPDCLCLAAGCMMWRWDKIKNPDWTPVHPILSVPQTHPLDGPQPFIDSTTDGYCGLAK